MINVALNYLKANEKVKWESDIETIYENQQFSVEQMHQIDLKILMECIQNLPTGYRIVLNMYAIEGYSHKEIAEELKINESTSRSQFLRAKALLEKRLSTLGFDIKKYASYKGQDISEYLRIAIEKYLEQERNTLYIPQGMGGITIEDK